MACVRWHRRGVRSGLFLEHAGYSWSTRAIRGACGLFVEHAEGRRLRKLEGVDLECDVVDGVAGEDSALDRCGDFIVEVFRLVLEMTDYINEIIDYIHEITVFRLVLQMTDDINEIIDYIHDIADNGIEFMI